MKDILVICLTRFGDLIQSTPLLRILKQSNPDARITIAILKQFDSILPLIRGFDRAFIFDKDEAARKIISDEDPLVAYRHMDDFISLLEQDCYDLIVNLTCDTMSAYIDSVLTAANHSGISASDNGQRVVNGMWGTYLFSVMQGECRKLNRINLVDIFTKMGEVNPDGQAVKLHETTAGKLFADSFIENEGLKGKTLIGIQLGASESARCWPVESFARLSDLLQANAEVRTILFGSKGEIGLAEQSMASMQLAPVDAVGKTGIEELYSLVKRCSFLVTNDTGTMHFAAACETPVIMLSLGPAFFRCTGPYSAGNIALQPQLACYPCRYKFNCHDPVCRNIISIECVHSACRLQMGEEVNLSVDFHGVGVYRSYFGTDGFLEWQSLCNYDAVQEELTKRQVRLWKDFFKGSPPSSHAGRHPLSRDLEILSERGMLLTSRIMAAANQNPIPMELISSLGLQESAVETDIKLLGISYPELAPIVDFLTLIRENITDGDLLYIAGQTHNLYEHGHRLASLM